MSGEPMKKLILTILIYIPLMAAVVTEPLTKGELSLTQRFNGTLQFNQQSRLAAQSEGVITKLYFDEGDYVKAGTLLLQIDTQILDAQIHSTQASIKELEFSLQKAQLDFKRYEALLAKQSVSKQQYDEFYFQKMKLEQQHAALQASLKAQLIQKEKKSVYAPFGGYISQRLVARGEWLKEGSEIALLINPKQVDLTFHLPASYLNHLPTSKKLEVIINQKPYNAKLIGPLLSGDEKTRTFPLRLRLLPTKDLFFDGMQAHIDLQKAAYTNTFLVSRDALLKKFGKEIIFVLKDNRAKMVPVTVIDYIEDKVALSSPELSVGDRIITKGNERIRPNQEIRP